MRMLPPDSADLFAKEIPHEWGDFVSFYQDFAVCETACEYRPRPGQHVRGFRVQVYPIRYGDPITVFEGSSIGHKAICPFPPLIALKLRVEITQADVEPRLKAIELQCAEGHTY